MNVANIGFAPIEFKRKKKKNINKKENKSISVV